jgi:hypothetical protein
MTTRMSRPAPKVKPKWSRAAIVALGVRTDLRTAGSIWGLSPTQVYAAAKAGRLPFPVLKIGSRYCVPVQPMLALLGIDGGEGNRSASADLRAPAEGEHHLRTAPASGGPDAA